MATAYALWKNEMISEMFNLPPYMVVSIAMASALAIGLKFIHLYYKNNRIEYEFTSIVNHTFRTPLTRVMWYSKELEKDLPTKDRLLYVQDITNATNKVLEIVDLFAGIKSINDRSGYYFEATSLRDIVERTIMKYREEINKKGIKFNVSTFKDIPLLTIDLKKISFVVDALIENAIFYTPKDSKVVIDAVSSKKNKITLYVTDSGMGLTWIDKMRVFQRFFRSKRAILMNPDGMGLKLYLSKQIIKRHKGRIYARSKGKDKGTTFFMELPLKH